MDTARLCVHLTQPTSGCRGPHVVSDIVSCFVRDGDEVTVLSISDTVISLRVNGQDVEVRHNGDWFSATCHGKVVCLNPFRTEATIVGATLSDRTSVPIVGALHNMWSSSYPITEATVKECIVGFESWIMTPVTYIETNVIVKAIHLVLVPTSVA